MSKGENIFKRKDGRWEARYVKGRDASGKIRYGFCYGRSYREAKEKVSIAKAAALPGAVMALTEGRSKLSFFCDEWLSSCRARVKESTYIKYEGILRKHIKPGLGDCCGQTVCEGLIESFTQGLLYDEGLSPKTVRDILTVLRSVLKYAGKRCPGQFPAIEISYPRGKSGEMRVLSREEQGRLVAELLRDTDPCKFGVLLALLTGLRIGELCALRWENISLEDKTVRISQSMQRIKNLSGQECGKTRILISEPKSEKSTRLIPISDETARLCRRMDPHSPAAFVLTGGADYMEPRRLQYRMKKLAEECGLEGVHFHTLRHTFATRCVEAGFEIKSLSEVLGHAGTTITLDRYVHASMELKRENMNKLTMLSPDGCAVSF